MAESQDKMTRVSSIGKVAPKEQSNGPKPMFADAEAIKEQLRLNIARPQYDVAKFYHEDGVFRYIATHTYFERSTLAVISLNALYISIDTDYNHSMSLLEAAWIFQFMEHFFCFYFTFEWFTRFMSFKLKRNGCKDAWFVFDSFMVVMMVGETWVMTIILLFAAGDSGGMGNAGIMKLLRLLRLSRMARMARLLRAMPELLILIKGMVSAMRSVFFTLLLQGIILYVFGITFKQLGAATPLEEEYFETVPASMHTLLVYGTLMDNIGELVAALGDESFIFPVVFYTFVLISALTVMNMLIGVLCEVVSAVATTEREELTVTYVKAKLKEILRQGGLDQDGDGMISKVEFAQILENPAAARILAECGVDVFGLVELSDFIFEKEDEHGQKQEGQLTFPDFMSVVLDLRGSNGATVKDIVDLRKFISATSKGLENKLQGFEKRVLKSLAESMDAMPLEMPRQSSCHSLHSRCQSKDSVGYTVESAGDPQAAATQSEKLFSHKEQTDKYTVRAVMEVIEDTPWIEDTPFVPCETDIGTGVRKLPNCFEMDELDLASATPMLDAAQVKSLVALPGFDGVRFELDRLRQHVDAELLTIAHDISRKCSGVSGVQQKGASCLAPSCARPFGRFEDSVEAPKTMPSSALFAMSPGAEMGTELSDMSELLARAGTALAWKSINAAAKDTLSGSQAPSNRGIGVGHGG